MLRREQEFRQLLQNNNISCIIPIILRGRDQIPDLLTVRRYYADFCDFDPDVEGTPPIHRHPKLKPLVREIVEYIDSVSANLRNQEGELCRNSANFVLIDFESQEGLQEITNFIDTNRPNRPPYPHLY
ncbi:MAG TPA: hypothetical protein PLQ21_10020, partial [Candidatus Kapabacteria bacterium]|nr:hypothetical protein [Candidatus Kapabacteria bacterium]